MPDKAHRHTKTAIPRFIVSVPIALVKLGSPDAQPGVQLYAEERTSLVMCQVRLVPGTDVGGRLRDVVFLALEAIGGTITLNYGAHRRNRPSRFSLVLDNLKAKL